MQKEWLAEYLMRYRRDTPKAATRRKPERTLFVTGKELRQFIKTICHEAITITYMIWRVNGAAAICGFNRLLELFNNTPTHLYPEGGEDI